MWQRLLPCLMVLSLLAIVTSPADADPAGQVVPSFNESPGCGPLDGYRGPIVPGSSLSNAVPIRGPWGDFFGRTIGQARAALVPVTLPGMDRPKTVWVHSRAVPAISQVIINLEEAAADGLNYTIRASYTSSYNPRSIPGKGYLSFHGVGTAIDINSHTNPYSGESENVLITNMPGWFVDAWTEAGWCWGGDWISLKDPMHFSWMGPIHTPDYGPVPAPYPPLTAPAPFDRAVEFGTALEGERAYDHMLVTDTDRDGAPDLVGIRDWTPAGHIRVETARAASEFSSCSTTRLTTGPLRADRVVMADADRDGRPDLWALDLTGATVEATIYPMAGGMAVPLAETVTAAPVTDRASYLAGDMDGDGYAELVMVLPGSETRIRAWRGPGFVEPILDTTNLLSSGRDWRFSLGDFDVDGVLDIYALSSGDPARVFILDGADQFSEPAERVASGVDAGPGRLDVADLDGDGRDDLYLTRDDGSLTVLLGDRRADGADLTVWFIDSRIDPQDCAPDGYLPDDPAFRSLSAVTIPGGALAVADPGDPDDSELIIRNPPRLITTNWVPGTTIDIAALDEGLAVLYDQDTSRVRITDFDGHRLRTIKLPHLTDPVAITVTRDTTGRQWIAVLGTGNHLPMIRVRGADGAPGLAIRPLLENPTAMRPVNLDGGADEIALAGTDDSGEAFVEIYRLDGTLLDRRLLGTSLEVLDLTPVLVEGYPGLAVLTSEAGSGAIRVFVLDADLDRVRTLYYPAATSAAISATGGTVVVGMRIERTGRVRIDARDAASAASAWKRSAAPGFDPASIASGDGIIWVVAHRMGDGAILIHGRNAATGTIAARSLLP